MFLSRREAIRLLGASAAATLVGELRAGAQAVRKASPRLPLEEFVRTPKMLEGLRRGVRAMNKRKKSDPLSWFYQAAIHGVTDKLVESAAKDDPGVQRVFRKRYWNQCPHDGESSADFLPWHRGFLLGVHA